MKILDEIINKDTLIKTSTVVFDENMINIKPRQNKHLYVDDEETRNRIIEVVNKWISQD